MRDGKAGSYIVMVKGKWESNQKEILGFKLKEEELRKLREIAAS